MCPFESDNDILDLLSTYGLSLYKELHRNIYQIRYIITNYMFEYSFMINLGVIVYNEEQYHAIVITGIKRAIEEYKKWKGENV